MIRPGTAGSLYQSRDSAHGQETRTAGQPSLHSTIWRRTAALPARPTPVVHGSPQPNRPLTGDPLCEDCYDYTAHLVWQWWAPELWRRFTIALRRQLAQHLKVSETAARQLVRLQFAKVAEYQRRGVIHFHALIRLDGPPSDIDALPAPTVDLDSTTWPISCGSPPALSTTLRQPSIRRTSRGGCGSVPSWTPARLLETPIGRHTVRSCTLRLLPPTSPSTPPKLRPTCQSTTTLETITCSGYKPPCGSWPAELRSQPLAGGEEPYSGWARWSDMLGFRGHLATKSRRYSVTLGRLRQARRDYTRRTRSPHCETPPGWADQDQDLEETTLVVGSWRFAGIGWLTLGDAALAAASAARARDA
jgi:hypothetical protein